MKKKHILYLLLTIFLDQVTKFWIASKMTLGQSIPVIDGFFSITYAQNTGAAWSMLEGRMGFFYVLTIVALGSMLYFYKEAKDDKATQLGLIFMIGGAIGNFIDRIRLKYVVDFLDFIIFGYDFPIFNLADTFLNIGVMVLIVTLVCEEIRGKKSNEKI